MSEEELSRTIKEMESGCHCHRICYCPSGRAAMYLKSLRAENDALKRDAERWRWARQDDTLWDGTYDYGIFSPEEADETADAHIAAMAAGEKP